jgi:predicted anti-sigma-YlaC factor YlaD
VVSERCERFRESVSLGLDGLLSTFERALLARHLARCPSCQIFARAITGQTALVRNAELDPLCAPVVVRPPAGVRLRRRAAGVAGAAAVAAIAALMMLMPTSTRQEANVGTAPLFKVVPEEPWAEATVELPRLRVVSPASADGPVHGLYGVPATI